MYLFRKESNKVNIPRHKYILHTNTNTHTHPHAHTYTQTMINSQVKLFLISVKSYTQVRCYCRNICYGNKKVL